MNRTIKKRLAIVVVALSLGGIGAAVLERPTSDVALHHFTPTNAGGHFLKGPGT